MGHNVRRDGIIRLVPETGEISVRILTERVGVSEAAVRKNLILLEEMDPSSEPTEAPFLRIERDGLSSHLDEMFSLKDGRSAGTGGAGRRLRTR